MRTPDPRALLLLPLLLAGCGGGDDAKDAYVQAATEVCERGAAEVEALESPTSAEGFAPYAEGLVTVAERVQADLAALEPPADDAEELRRRVLDPFDDVVEQGREFAADVRAAGDDQAALLPLLSQLPDAGEVDLDYLRDYGLPACADALDPA